MDHSKEGSNIFLPLDKTSTKFQEAKSLFGGTSSIPSKQEGSGSFNSSAKPVASQNIFGNSSKGFESSTASSTKKYGQLSKEQTAQNPFQKSSSSIVTSGTIFGQVTPLSSGSFQAKQSSFSTSSISSPSSPVPTVTSLSSQPLDFKSVSDTSYREIDDTSHSASISTSSGSVSSEKFGSGTSAMFTLRSREGKDSTDNIFGGKASQTSPLFKDQQIDRSKIKSDSSISGESSYKIFGNKDQAFPFGEYSKPEKVFASTKVVNNPSSKSFAFESLNKAKTQNKQSYNVFKKPSEPVDKPTEFLNVAVSPSSIKPIQKESPLLIACDIDEKYFHKSVLENHFSKFGVVKKTTLRRVNETKQALIQFVDPKDAQEAKLKGKRLHPLVPEMKLFFGNPPQPKRKTEIEPPIPPKLTKPVILNRPRNSSSLTKKVMSGSQKLTNVKVIESSKPVSFTSKAEVKSKAPSGNIGSIKEFSILMKTQAKNNYDKYLILDARDKNIRAKQKKISDVTKAHYLFATCPDMCPEKERYSRDIQYDISAYEMTNNEIDHKLSVKKFSRSSADKDEPLPHELRPGPVLKKTMDFLVCNIVQKGDDRNVQLDIWYNYLCNRTRGLRSDIMQQHLLDINAVYVLERCIRFHIHCSHQLCEESPEYFDAKMNSEHLSKSLQSLKELYHDLDQRGYSFENEAEFRAYEILLSINDGNVIFKYLNFKESVRTSSEVQFAVKVIHSLHANNYSSFFRLLKKATYLQACIMHRYFSNIQPKALNVIARAYGMQQLPVDLVKTMLGFSVESEFQSYVEHFGVEISDDSKVIISKNKFTPTPDTPPPITKSNMISIKKNVSIGEIVHNGRLPENPFPHYRPHSSFNSKGYLNEKAIDASDQGFLTAAEAELKQSSIEKDFENERIEHTALKKADSRYKQNLLGKYFAAWKKFAYIQNKIKILQEKARMRNARKYVLLWKKKAYESAVLKQKADCFLMIKYFDHWKTYACHMKENRYLLQVAKIIEETFLLRKFVKLWKWKVSYLKSERKAKFARNHVLAFKYFNKWLIRARELILEKKCDEYFTYRLMKTSFSQWQSWCTLKKNKNKRNVETFPAISSLLALEEQNKMLSWGYERGDKMNMSAHEINELDKDIISKRRKHYSIQKFSNMVAWSALPLVQTVQRDIRTKSPDFSRNSLYSCFKILILIESDTDLYLLEWVRTKFNILEYEDISKPLQCQYNFTSPHNEVTYSIVVTEEKLSYASRNLDSSSIVILVGNENKLENLKNYSKNLNNVPYLSLCKSLNESLSENLWLMTKETIESPFTSEKLFNFVTHHWRSRKSRFNMQVNSCVNIVHKFVLEKILSPVNKEVSQRQHYGKPSLEPEKVVLFYNSAISHIISSLEKAKLNTCDWPPSELNSPPKKQPKLWNNKDSTVVLASLQNAYLPYFNIQLNQSWCQTEEDLAKYIKELIAPSDWEGSLYSEVKTKIKEARKKFFEDKFNCDHRLKTDKFWYCIPWIEILNCFILFKLSRLPDINIAFTVSDLETYDCAQYWLSELKISEVEIPAPTKKVVPVKRKAVMVAQKVNLKKIKSDSRLLREIENEKQKTLEYEKQLEDLLIIDEELKLLYPNVQF